MKDKWNQLDQLLETLSEMVEKSSMEETSALERILKRHKKTAPVQKVEEESALMRVLRKYKNRKPKVQEVEDVEEDFFQSFLEELEEEDQPDLDDTPRKKRKPVRLSEEELLDKDVELKEALRGEASDIYALGMGGLWLGLLLGAAMPYAGSASLMLVPDTEKHGFYYMFSRNRRIEMDLEFMEDGALKVNVQQAPTGFYRSLRMMLQNLRRVRYFLPPLETQSELLHKVLSVFHDLKVDHKAEEAE